MDMHCHLLPEVDDGAQNIQETAAMMKIAYDDGIRTIMVTPHHHGGRYQPSKEKIRRQYAKLQEMLHASGLDLHVYLGQEIYYQQEIPERLNQGELFTLAASNYVLIEFSGNVLPSEIRMAVQSLTMEGYLPILAHVERYGCLVKEPAMVTELVELGAYIQVNGASILEGSFGTKRYIKGLLKKGLVHLVASDAHGTSYRTPELSKVYEKIVKKYGTAYGRELLVENPERIIRNEYI